MKSALTFAEIFIVMALIFIIQTVINFGLYDDPVADGGRGVFASDIPHVANLDILQIPSGGDDTDHVAYLVFSVVGESDSREELVVEVNGWPRVLSVGRGRRASPGGGGLLSRPTVPLYYPYVASRGFLQRVADQRVAESAANCKYFLSEAVPGTCDAGRSCAEQRSRRWWEESHRREILQELGKWGLSMRVGPGSEAAEGNGLGRVRSAREGQRNYELWWSPREAPDGVELRVGMYPSELPGTGEDLRVRQEWRRAELGLANREELNYPHPLIFRRRDLKNSGLTPPDVWHEFNHRDLKPAGDRNESTAGFLFDTEEHGCESGEVTHPARLREIVLSLT